MPPPKSRKRKLMSRRSNRACRSSVGASGAIFASICAGGRRHDDIFYRSLHHDIICAYHLAPAPDFVLNEGGRFVPRTAVRLDIERAKALLHIGHLEHLDGGL